MSAVAAMLTGQGAQTQVVDAVPIHLEDGLSKAREVRRHALIEHSLAQ
jgi:hypothetical protein